MSRNVSELAQRLNRLNGKGGKFPPLFLMTDAKRLLDPSRYIALLPKGSGIIVRHFQDAEKIKLIKKIKPLCQKHQIKLYVSDAVHMALTHQLDGVHFSEQAVKKIAGCGFLRRVKPKLLYSAACHSARAAQAAKRVGLDIIFISPVFPTQSHPGAASLGAWQFHRLSRTTPLKPYGLGGINAKTAQRLITSKACGFAGIGSLLNTE